jgi:hypothetical protein
MMTEAARNRKLLLISGTKSIAGKALGHLDVTQAVAVVALSG